MSLVVMRRKARENNPRIAPISGHLGTSGKTGVGGLNGTGSGGLGFSINGGIRNLRGIGVTRMVGSGGWSGGGRGAGRFAHGNASWYFSVNDSSIIKKSSKGNAAMIDMKYRWIKGSQYPRSWHKDIPSATLDDPCVSAKTCYRYVGNGGIKKRVRWGPVTKDAPKNAMSQSEYIEKGSVQKRECLSLKEPNKFTHFPIYIRHRGCDVNYLTWQAAVAAKVLPDNYVGSGR
jgi:hypothetical protein